MSQILNYSMSFSYSNVNSTSTATIALNNVTGTIEEAITAFDNYVAASQPFFDSSGDTYYNYLYGNLDDSTQVILKQKVKTS